MKLIINKDSAHLIYDALDIQKTTLHRQIKELKKLVSDDDPVLQYAYNKYGNITNLMESIDLGIVQE